MMTLGDERPFYKLLPEIYKRDGIMDALLKAFEKQYLKIEETIDGLPDQLYDPGKTPDEFLDFLWRMFGCQTIGEVFSQRQQRELIPLLYRLQRQKGTKTALSWLMKAFASDLCGHWVYPVIVEYGSWSGLDLTDEQREKYRQIFGGEDDFTVLLPPEPALGAPEALRRLTALAQEYSPADSQAHVEVLDTRPFLGQNNYLGVNTYI